jgi:hypothetical protein
MDAVGRRADAATASFQKMPMHIQAVLSATIQMEAKREVLIRRRELMELRAASATEAALQRQQMAVLGITRYIDSTSAAYQRMAERWAQPFRHAAAVARREIASIDTAMRRTFATTAAATRVSTPYGTGGWGGYGYGGSTAGTAAWYNPLTGKGGGASGQGYTEWMAKEPGLIGGFEASTTHIQRMVNDARLGASQISMVGKTAFQSWGESADRAAARASSQIAMIVNQTRGISTAAFFNPLTGAGAPAVGKGYAQWMEKTPETLWGFAPKPASKLLTGTAFSYAGTDTGISKSHVEAVKMNKAFDESAKALERMNNQSQVTTTAMRNMGEIGRVSAYTIARGIFMAAAAIALLESGARFLFKPFIDGIQAVDDFRLSVLQSAAVITSMATDKSNPAETFQQAKAYAEDLNRALELWDAQTLASIQNLRAMNVQFQVGGFLIRANNDSHRQFTISLANMIGTLAQGANIELQYVTETRDLMSGIIRPMDRVAMYLNDQIPGGLKKFVAEVKAGKKEWIDLLPYMEGFNAASDEMERTMTAVKTTMSTIYNRVLREGLEPGFERLVDMAFSLKGVFIDNEGNLTDTANLVGEKLLWGFNSILTVVQEIGIAIEAWNRLLGEDPVSRRNFQLDTQRRLMKEIQGIEEELNFSTGPPLGLGKDTRPPIIRGLESLFPSGVTQGEEDRAIKFWRPEGQANFTPEEIAGEEWTMQRVDRLVALRKRVEDINRRLQGGGDAGAVPPPEITTGLGGVGDEADKAMKRYESAHLEVIERIKEATLGETDYKIWQLGRWQDEIITAYKAVGADTTEITEAYSVQQNKILEDHANARMALMADLEENMLTQEGRTYDAKLLSIDQKFQKMSQDWAGDVEVQTEIFDKWVFARTHVYDDLIEDLEKKERLMGKVGLAKEIEEISISYEKLIKSVGDDPDLIDRMKKQMEVEKKVARVGGLETQIQALEQIYSGMKEFGIYNLDVANQAINLQAQKFGEALGPEHAGLVQDWAFQQEQLRGEEAAQLSNNYFWGMQAGIQQSQRELERMGAAGFQTVEILENGFNRAADALVEFAETGKFAFSDLITSILKDLLRLTIQQGVTQPLFNMLLNIGSAAIGGAAAGGGSWSTPVFDPNVAPVYAPGYAPTSVAHLGGIIGQDGFPTRIVSADVFHNAVRAHSGLLPGERPIIARENEAVVPLPDGRTIPVDMRNGAFSITVDLNIKNESNVPMEAQEKSGPDGRKIIDLLVGQALNRKVASGEFDKLMERRYGLRYPGSPR